jgi:hypothetical protein
MPIQPVAFQVPFTVIEEDPRQQPSLEALLDLFRLSRSIGKTICFEYQCQNTDAEKRIAFRTKTLSIQLIARVK